jgi:integrase/recombinase XerD
MTPLRKRMLEELQRRNYAQLTIDCYIQIVEDFSTHFGRRPDQLGAKHLREYQVYLFRERKLSRRTVSVRVSALRFFFVKMLKRPYMMEYLPFPKKTRTLPAILTPQEVTRLIDGASNLMHRAILMTLYATGIRRSELVRLRVADIDSQRMVVHIRQGKGGHDRDVPLSPKLLETLREYWRWMKPKIYLFPGTVNSWRADVPISSKLVWHACRQAADRAGLDKDVSPHRLRHSFATHLLDAGADLYTIQRLLGHADLRHTEVYLQLSERHLRAAPSPIDTLTLSDPSQVKRSRKLIKR